MSLDLYQGRHLHMIDDETVEQPIVEKQTEDDDTADLLLTTDHETPPILADSVDSSSPLESLRLPLKVSLNQGFWFKLILPKLPSPPNGIPFDLAKGEQKRKRVLQEMKKKKDMKNIMSLVAEQTEETNVRNLFALQVMKYQENVLNSCNN